MSKQVTHSNNLGVQPFQTGEPARRAKSGLKQEEEAAAAPLQNATREPGLGSGVRKALKGVDCDSRCSTQIMH